MADALLKQEVETLYNSGMLVKDIVRKLKINEAYFYKIVNELKSENRLILRRGGQRKQRIYDRNNPKYYSRNTYRDSYVVKYKRRYYASVKTRQQAERFVELMKECDWDYSKRLEVKRKVMME